MDGYTVTEERDVTLRPGWHDDSPSGPLRDYMKVRANAQRDVLANTTAESFPFTLAGADIAYSLCFDLLGEGARYYVVISVHR